MRIGVLGGGQLGWMLGLAAAKRGIACRFLDPANDAPAARVGEHVCAPFEDVEALGEFARGLDVVTYEFENVPATSVEWLAERVPVAPPVTALRTAQDRLLEKEFFRRHGVATAPCVAVDTHEDFRRALADVGLPALLKTRRYGYDGKGQRTMRTLLEAERAFEALRGVPLLVEGHVSFQREVSQISAGWRDGSVLHFPLVENHHRGGILRMSLAPAPGASPVVVAQARACTEAVMREFGYVGVLAVEFFECDGRLLANEMAPRVHNSGHWSMGAAPFSQFDAHIAAVANLPAGDPMPPLPAAMVNIIGAFPPRAALDAVAGADVVDYGKLARPGRKLGHVTVTATDWDLLLEKVDRLRRIADEAEASHAR